MKFDEDKHDFPFYVVYAYGDLTEHQYTTKKEAIKKAKEYAVSHVYKITGELVFKK